MSEERKLISIHRYQTGYGTHHYIVKYKGDWGEWALINCVDEHLFDPDPEEYERYNQDCRLNFGGYVEKQSTDEQGITTAKVGVYYD